VLMFFARFAIFRLVEATPSSRSWRPSLLVFTGKPTQVSDYLLTLSSAVTQTKGFLTIASFLFSEKEEREQLSELKQKTYNLLKRHRIQALVQIDYVDHLISGMKRIIYNYGIGPLKPNTIILGAPDKEEISTQYGEVIKVAYERGRNIVLINENGKEATEKNFYSERKEIHIWWDDQSQANSELLIILAHMLQRSPHWKKSPIILFDVIANEHQKFDRQQRLEEFLKQNRLSMQLQILVSSDKDKELFHLLKAFSSQASMAFLGMRPPLGISQEDYSSYLQTLSIKDEALPPLAWVLNGQKMHLNGVLQTSHL
jgi:solute carrier family 12 (potassium/chloride transporter), member 4/6